ncbi:MAG: hypothetical protein GX032_02020 [Tenericutes bacterium]|nr:hypothetical protein [Bacilli bacterium]NLV90227.1 hypothetical protein [Mycoplasmatota bacterium]
MNSNLKVNFTEIEKSIQNINNSLVEVNTLVNDLNKAILSIDEGWNDKLYKSSENFKTSLKEKVVDKIVANNLLLTSLIEEVQAAMIIYIENETKWQNLINNTNL